MSAESARVSAATAPTGTTSSPPLPAQPYVGLRSFERAERTIFFGRSRDAGFLRDRIFASRLTVFHGASGSGKSSLLKVLIVPLLEREEALPLYFDAWTAEDPLAALKSELGERAGSVGVPDASAGAPTLAELVALINVVASRTVVLILDQFEEFLLTQSRLFDAFRRELAALVRSSGPDVRVVLSLRSEFLGALEPLREDVPGLFQSTHLLLSLGEDGLRSAIEDPAALFDVAYESDLVDKLLADLAATESVAPVETSAIELPMLQLVCEQLWARREGQTLLTTELYKKHNGLRAILDDYVASVMPRTFEEQRLTATLLKALAPPSGLKVSFTPEDLAAVSGETLAAVRSELGRLAGKRILRPRQYRSGTRYELQHDAFIAVVSPWRDRVFERERARKNWLTVLRIVGAVTLVAMTLWIGLSLQDRWRDQAEYAHRVTQPFAALRAEQSSAKPTQPNSLASPDNFKNQAMITFDEAAAYLLRERSGPERLSQLEQLLKENADLLPAQYGIESSGVDFIVLKDWSEDWPLTVHYSKARDLDLQQFTHQWQSLASFFASSWGLPVPTQLRLKAEDDYPLEYVRVDGPGIDPTVLNNTPADEHMALITEATLAEPTREFLRAVGSTWPTLEDAELGGPWRVVPLWSLPAWKSSGLATNGSGILAFRLALELQSHRDRLLGHEAVEFLLDRMKAMYPVTVAEARAARGDRIRGDLVEILKADRGLASLPSMLDLASDAQEDASGVVGERVVLAMSALVPELPTKVHGPWAAAKAIEHERTVSARDATTRRDALKSSEAWLPEVRWPILIDLGAALSQGAELFDEMTLTPQALQMQWDVRSDFYRRFGVILPWSRLRDDSALEANSFRIELLHVAETDELAKPIATSPADALARIGAALSVRTAQLRTYFVAPEQVAELVDGLEPNLRAWLTATYSFTDLKGMLRGVIAPDSDERERWGSAAPEAQVPVSPTSTLRPIEWLLGSLVFFSMTDGSDMRSLVEHMKGVQSARLLPPLSAQHAADEPAIARGLRALAQMDVKAAQTAFKQALLRNPREALANFVHAYPKLAPLTTLRFVQRECSNGALTTGGRIELHDLLVGIGAPIPAEEAQRLWFCLFEDRSDRGSRERLGVADEMAARYPAADAWTPKQAMQLGLGIATSYDVLSPSPARLEWAARLLERALVQPESPWDRRMISTRIAETCGQPGPRAWCRALEKRLITVQPNWDMLYSLAAQLVSRESKPDIEQALGYIERLDALVTTSFPVSVQAAARKDVSTLRLYALDRLTNLGQANANEQLEPLARELLALGVETARSTIGQRLLEANRIEDATRLFEEGSKAAGFDDLFMAALASGSMERVGKVASDALASAEDVSVGAETQRGHLFIAACGQILTGAGDWERTARRFIATPHRYAPYVAIMTAARRPGQGGKEEHDVLKRASQRADRAHWHERLREEDPAVWREMLIDYHRGGEVKARDIFDPLESEPAFNASELRFAGFPRMGMLCEAYFYDALRLKAQGDMAGAKQRLEQTVGTNYTSYFEYWMARFLLTNEPGS